MRITSLLGITIGAITALSLTSGASAQSYPTKPIRIIVPQAPGGGNDLNARMVAQPLAERVGQPVVVENKPGAGSIIGSDFVAKAPPDGYTLLSVSSSIAILPSMNSKTPFDPVKDFTPIALLSSYPHVVVVTPSSAITSIKALIAAAKSKPGAINFGSAGNGTPTQLGPELFKSLTGVSMTHVPYNGGGPALAGLIGGQTQVYFGPMPAVLAQIKANKVRPIAVTSITRSKVLPDVPTIAESGVSGFRQDAWNGLLAPARMPVAIVEKLNTEINAALGTPAIKQRYAAQGTEVGGMSYKEFAALLKSEVSTWSKVIREAGIKAE